MLAVLPGWAFSLTIGAHLSASRELVQYVSRSGRRRLTIQAHGQSPHHLRNRIENDVSRDELPDYRDLEGTDRHLFSTNNFSVKPARPPNFTHLQWNGALSVALFSSGFSCGGSFPNLPVFGDHAFARFRERYYFSRHRYSHWESGHIRGLRSPYSADLTAPPPRRILAEPGHFLYRT